MALDDRAGVQLGEITGASDREFAFLLNKPNVATFSVPTNHRLAVPLLSMATRIRLYYGATLMMHADVIGANRTMSRDERKISVTAADPLWQLGHRLVGKSAAGTFWSTLTDRGAIMKSVIDTLNTEYAAYGTHVSKTGLRTGTLSYLSGSTVTYNTGPFKPADEVLRELGLGTNGFDWEAVPIAYNGGYIADWRAAPVLGVTRTNVKFGFGAGTENNMREIADTVDGSTMANYVWHVSPSGPDTPGQPLISALDTAGITAYGVREDVVAADLMDTTLRQAIVDEHIRVRKRPRRIVTFQPRYYDPTKPGNVPVFGTDYLLGDLVQSTARDESGVWFDAYFRVYGYTAKPDANGLESGDLLVVDEG